MTKLTLKWSQARSLKEQIEAAEAGVKFGRAGCITVPSDLTVEWDDWKVVLDMPEEDDDCGGVTDVMLGTKKEGGN